MAAAVVMPLKPLFLQNATNYTALDLRSMIEDFWLEGVDGQSGLSISQRAAGTNMSVDVDLGTAVIQGNSPAGSRYYVVRNDVTPVNVTLDAAPGSNSRIDLIVATVRDAAVGGGSNNDWVLQAVTGTSGASPSPPAVPNNSLELARVLVASGTSAITNAMITDRRTCMLQVARYFNALPAVSQPGQLCVDYGAGRVYRDDGTGGWIDLQANVPKRQPTVGATLFGGVPPTNSVYRWDYDTEGIVFDGSNGRGMINLNTAFSGIVAFYAEAIGNGKTYSISRRTAGDSISGTQIPITAIEHSPFGNAFASGTVTVTWHVLGW